MPVNIWTTPRASYYEYAGRAGLGQSLTNLGDSITKMIEKQKERGRLATALRRKLDILDPDHKHEHTAMGYDDLLGKDTGLAALRIANEDKDRREKHKTDMQTAILQQQETQDRIDRALGQIDYDKQQRQQTLDLNKAKIAEEQRKAEEAKAQKQFPGQIRRALESQAEVESKELAVEPEWGAIGPPTPERYNVRRAQIRSEMFDPGSRAILRGAEESGTALPPEVINQILRNSAEARKRHEMASPRFTDIPGTDSVWGQSGGTSYVLPKTTGQTRTEELTDDEGNPYARVVNPPGGRPQVIRTAKGPVVRMRIDPDNPLDTSYAEIPLADYEKRYGPLRGGQGGAPRGPQGPSGGQPPREFKNEDVMEQDGWMYQYDAKKSKWNPLYRVR